MTAPLIFASLGEAIKIGVGLTLGYIAANILIIFFVVFAAIIVVALALGAEYLLEKFNK